MGAKVIERLAVELVAHNAKFQSKLLASQRRAKEFATKTNAAMGVAGRAVSGFAVVGTAAFIAMYKRSAQAGDQIAKMADQLGIAVKQLHGLRHAGVITGVEIGTMDKALQKLNKNVGEAASGLGTAKPYLERMGLATKEFFALSPDKQFSVLSEEINKLGTQQEKAAVSQALFGRAGGDLLNTMALGAKGIRAMTEEAEALGVGLSRVDNAKFEAANDQMYRASQAVKGLGNRISVELAPYVEAIAKQFTDAAVEAGGFAEATASASDIAVKSVAYIADGILIVRKAWALVKVASAEGVNFIVQGAVSAQKAFLDFYNSLPGGDFREELKGSEALNFLSRSTATSLEQARKDALAIANTKLPSGDIIAKAAQIKKQAQGAAEKVAQTAADRNSGSTDTDTDTIAGDDDKTAKEVDAFNARSAKLFELKLQEDQKLIDLEQFRHNRALAKAQTEYEDLIQKSVDKEAITATHLSNIENMNALHDKRIERAGKRETKNQQAANKFKLKGAAAATSGALGEMTRLSAGTAQHSKKMFEMHKALTLANIAVKTPEAVAGAYAFGANIGGPALGVIMGGMAFASQAAQAQAALSTNFEGGGRGTTPSSAGVAPAVNDIPVTSAPTSIAPEFSAQQQEPQTVTNIYIDSLGSATDSEEIVDIIKDAVDRDVMVIATNSENARRIREAA